MGNERMNIEVKHNSRQVQGRISHESLNKLCAYSDMFGVNKCTMVSLAVQHLLITLDQIKREVESNVIFGGNMKDLFRKHMEKRTMNYATMPLKLTFREMPYEDRIWLELELMHNNNKDG